MSHGFGDLCLFYGKYCRYEFHRVSHSFVECDTDMAARKWDLAIARVPLFAQRAVILACVHSIVMKHSLSNCKVPPNPPHQGQHEAGQADAQAPPGGIDFEGYLPTGDFQAGAGVLPERDGLTIR